MMSGVVFANEVLDALPTTRFTLQGDEVYEEYVAVRGDAFVREDRPADTLVSAAQGHVERYLIRPSRTATAWRSRQQLPY